MRDVRRIAEDEVETLARWDRREEIAQQQSNSILHAVPDGVALGHGQGVRADVHRGHAGARMLMGDGDGKVAGAGADVKNTRVLHLLGQLQTFHHDILALWTRDQDGWIDFERE